MRNHQFVRFTSFFLRVPTRPGRYANSPWGVPTHPVRCGSFIQLWQNFKVQILKIAVICSQDWNLIIDICFIILCLNMASVEATEQNVSNSPGLPYLKASTGIIFFFLLSILFFWKNGGGSSCGSHRIRL